MEKFFILTLLIFCFFFLIGCYGFQDPAQCENLNNPVEQMNCYKKAALNAAYANDPDNANILCNKIASIGQAYAAIGSNDMERQAEIASNRCYYDAAVALGSKNPSAADSMCNSITEKTNVFGLKGSKVTAAGCSEEVRRLSAISPEQYYSNPSNICALVAVLLMPLAVFLFYRVIHKL